MGLASPPLEGPPLSPCSDQLRFEAPDDLVDPLPAGPPATPDACGGGLPSPTWTDSQGSGLSCQSHDAAPAAAAPAASRAPAAAALGWDAALSDWAEMSVDTPRSGSAGVLCCAAVPDLREAGWVACHSAGRCAAAPLPAGESRWPTDALSPPAAAAAAAPPAAAAVAELGAAAARVRRQRQQHAGPAARPRPVPPRPPRQRQRAAARARGRPRVYDTVTPVLDAALGGGTPSRSWEAVGRRGAKPKYVFSTKEEAVAMRRERNRATALASYYRRKARSAALADSLAALRAESVALESLLDIAQQSTECAEWMRPLLEAGCAAESVLKTLLGGELDEKGERK